MKNIVAAAIITVALISSQFTAYADNSEMEMLVDMLVQNGALTRDQATTLAEKAKERAAQQAKEKAAQRAQTEVARQATIATIAPQKWNISDKSMNASWDNGICFKNADGSFEATVEGRLYEDMLYTNGQSSAMEEVRPAGDFLRRNDRAFIRDARLGVKGTIYEDFFFEFEYDFAGNTTNGGTQLDGIKEAVVGMKDIPYIGMLTIGHFKQPFSLEEVGSKNNITFLERALPVQAFSPGYQWGGMINNDYFDERVTFAVSAFRNSTGAGIMASGNEWNFATRLTFLPWYEEDGKLMHLGAAYCYRLPESGGWSNTNNRVQLRSRPELYTRDYIVDTGNINISSEKQLGVEGAVVYGPLSLQGEMIETWLDGPSGQLTKTAPLFGAYGYISYILTGEHREYNRSSGKFKGVTPEHIFSLRHRTWGAWEIAARASYLDLDHKSLGILGGISGGQAVATTLGVNWYLNPNMRLMVNYVHADRAGYGAIDGIQTRAQVNFD